MPFGGLLTAGIIGAVGSIGGGLIGSSGAQKAADTQAQASEQVAQLQAQSQQKALDFQKQVYGQQQQNAAPFLTAGQNAISTLTNENRVGGNLSAPWTQQFQAPTNVTEQNDPGYQFRLQQANQAIERSAAAQGNLLSGGTLKDLTNYSQDYASNEYNNVYGRALGQYQQAYNIFEQNQANRFNRLASVAGVGQTAAGQLNSAGQSAVGANASTLLGGAQAIGQAQQNAAAARASGYVGSANAIGGAFGGVANQAQLIPLYNMLNQGQGQIATSGGPNGG